MEAEYPTTPRQTLPQLEQVKAQYPVSSKATVQLLDLRLTLPPERTVDAFTILQQTTAPPKQPEVTFPNPKQVQSQRTSVQPVYLEIPQNPKYNAVAGPFPTTQEIPVEHFASLQ